jgi:hypothetical protein
MATNYPGSVDDFATTSPTNLADDDSTGRTHSERHNDIESAMEAVQSSLIGSLDPDDVTDLVAWYKAGSISGADNDPINAWVNSANAGTYDMASDGSTARPLLKTGIINSLPVLRFDGVNDYMLASAGPTLTDYTLILVVAQRDATPTSNAGVFCTTITGSTNDYASGFAFINKGTNVGDWGHDTLNVGITIPRRPVDYFSVTSVVTKSGIVSGASGDLAFTAVGTSGASMALTKMAVGARLLSGAVAAPYGQVDVAEICLYSRGLTAFEVTSVRAGLATKYAL